MKKFEIVYIMLFLQIGVIMTGLIQVGNNTFLASPLIDILFFNEIEKGQDSIDYLSATATNITRSDTRDVMFATQPYQLCLPLTNICTSKIEILSFTPFVFLGQLVNLGMSLLTIPISMLLYATIFAGRFYTVVLYMVLPQTLNSRMYASYIGLFLGLLQTMVIIGDIAKSFKGFTVATVGVFLDLDEGGTIGRGVSRTLRGQR